MKNKETLEEAAENYAIDKQNENTSKYYMALESFQEGAKWQQEQHKIDTDDAYNEGFENGKNWQAERMYSEEELQQKIDAHLEVAKDLWLSAIKEQKRMYSEEEVGEILYNAFGEYGKHYGIMIDGKMLNDLFEQFKRK